MAYGGAERTGEIAVRYHGAGDNRRRYPSRREPRGGPVAHRALLAAIADRNGKAASAASATSGITCRSRRPASIRSRNCGPARPPRRQRPRRAHRRRVIGLCLSIGVVRDQPSIGSVRNRKSTWMGLPLSSPAQLTERTLPAQHPQRVMHGCSQPTARVALAADRLHPMLHVHRGISRRSRGNSG